MTDELTTTQASGVAVQLETASTDKIPVTTSPAQSSWKGVTPTGVSILLSPLPPQPP